MITNFSNFTDEELISESWESAEYSPLIRELRRRLEKAVDALKEATTTEMDCPTCGAHLLVTTEPLELAVNRKG